MEVADQIVVMHEGRIEQIGSPLEIYENPATPFVMRFVGEVNVLPAEVLAGERDRAESLYIRPHDLELLDQPVEHSMPAKVRRLVHLGKEVNVELQLDNGQQLHAQIPREWIQTHSDRLQAGTKLYLRPRRTHSFN